jgi:hypothetical protein
MYLGTNKGVLCSIEEGPAKANAKIQMVLLNDKSNQNKWVI